ncbi:MAG TPA: response regulator [Candidatus Dormibacteraeota bacterium]|nr:response regulator [Candidatus Dormibacteraeota bacterium]
MSRVNRDGTSKRVSPVRVYLTVVALATLPLAFFLIFAHNFLSRKVTQQVIAQSADTGKLVSNLIDEEMKQRKLLLASFSGRPDLLQAWKNNNAREVTTHLEQAHGLRPDFVFFGVYDLNGSMQAMYPQEPGLLGKNFNFMDWFKGVRKEWKPYTSEVYQFDAKSTSQVVSIAVPLRNFKGNQVAILMTAIPTDTIMQDIHRLSSPNNKASMISLVDQNGHVFGSPNARIHLIDKHQQLSQEFVDQVAGRRSGARVLQVKGEELIVSYSPMPNLDWGVLIEIPVAAIRVSLWDYERKLAGLGLFIIGLVVAGGGGVASLYRKLRDREHYSRLIVERAQDAFISMDSNGVVTEWNPEAERTFGWSRSEAAGRKVEDLIIPSSLRERHREGLRRSLTTAERPLLNRRTGIIALHKDGHEFPAEISISPVLIGSEYIFNIFLRDVTETKRAQRLIEEQNRQLESHSLEVQRATRLKSEFLASMSHELRTPLNAIVGFSDLLAEETAGALNPKQKRFVGHVRNGATHLLALINDILDLSKIEAGQLEIFPENVSLQRSLTEVLSLVQPLTDKRKVTLNIVPEEFTVYADRVRLKQVLYNLLSNAVKFTPERGSITVEAHAEGGQVYISVSDTGVGIRKEDQAVIFDEFRQVGESAKGIKEGTGLGLAITRKLVEQQGGAITVASEPGKGSRFTFTLPMGIAADASNNTTYQNSGSREHPVVLIVDDDPTARELLMNYLGPQGYVVITAASGTEALAKAKEFRPDAITLNMLSPGQTGWLTLYELKHNTGTADIPIIVVSVVDQKGMAFTLGASEYLVKPVARETLLAKLVQHVGSSRDGVSRVLVAEDEVTTMRIMEGILKSAGYEPVPALNGKEAILVLERMRVDLVLLDLQMPEMDGFEVIKRIREHPQWRDLPIFVLTAKKLTDSEIDLLTKETRAVFSKGHPWKEALLADIKKAIAAPKALTKEIT